jgi:DNA mismatch endonuclease (patch repair protein)
MIMAGVKNKNTGPELQVRSLLHKLGYRFRLHEKELPGCPDIVFKKRKKAIFVHGCFWHGHEGCARSVRPTSNIEFWNKKLSGNFLRDRRNMEALDSLGWQSLVVWTCELKDMRSLEFKLKEFLEDEIKPDPGDGYKCRIEVSVSKR